MTKRVVASCDVSAEGARAVVRAVVEAATAAGCAVSVAVVDSAGVLVAFERMDGVLRFSADLAAAKARTSAAFGRPTASMEEVMRERPVFAQSFVQQGGWYLGRGGHPLSVDGRPAGGVGVSGDAAEVEDELARAAAASFADPEAP
ncbi:heme-binding protein [Streptomyces sp. SID3343]|uniref:GlcG/HbpS family heme-binding protein n=1 Tax=Streptomyces sp. SID3343 TaxID=2690260 RepID=UPI00136EB8FE|nr:heme-binding protein [Streptomyces sp. SID3343]MYW04095.1 heme-binding protein [Streptomyces sp. SID3343]